GSLPQIRLGPLAAVRNRAELRQRGGSTEPPARTETELPPASRASPEREPGSSAIRRCRAGFARLRDIAARPLPDHPCPRRQSPDCSAAPANPDRAQWRPLPPPALPVLSAPATKPNPRRPTPRIRPEQG